MLEQRERGEEPDFDGFMERYGDFFPGNPQTLDELLEQMARSMAQMQQMLNSMTPEQRASSRSCHESLLDDMDLRWQVDQLGQNLRNAFPQMGWGPRMPLPRRRADAARPDGQPARPARRHRRARAPAPQRDQPRPARRGRPRPGPRAARRRRRPLTSSSSLGARQGARGSGPHRAARGPARAHAEGHPRIGQQGARRPVPQAAAGPQRPARDRARRARSRARRRAQALRVRRPVPPRRRGDDPERDLARRARARRCASAPTTSRSSAPSSSTRSATVLDARRLAVDGDARPLPRRPRRSRWRCTR